MIEEFKPPADTFRLVVEIPPEEAVFVDMVFKSYEGIAMLTHDEGAEGIVKIDLTPGTYELVLDILDDLGDKFAVEILSDEYASN